MKNQKRLMMWFVGFFLTIFSFSLMGAGEPTYLCRIENAAQVSCNVYEFDVVMQRTGTTTLRLANFQFGILVDSGIIPVGATCNTSMVPGSANALNVLMRPTDAKFIFDNTKNCIIVTPVAPQGWANSTIISNLATGTKLCRVRVACSQSWTPAVNTAHAWNFSTTNGYPTKIFAYIGAVSPGINTDITSTGVFSVSASPSGNITTTNNGTPPSAQTISADMTQICMLPDVGATITLNNTESGYSYYLYRNGVPVTGAGSIAFGTGSAVSFNQLMPDGTITVKSPGCSGLIDMTNSVTLTGIVPINASVTVTTSPGITVEPGTIVTFTANPVNGGATPGFQWYVNGVGDYINGMTQTYSYTPADGDQVYCEMYSSVSCVTPAAAVPNTITMTVMDFPHLFNVSGSATICQGATTSVTLDSSQIGYNYDLFKNGVLVAGQQKPGTGLPLVWNVAVSGTYTVVASIPSVTMNGSAVVVVNPILTPSFTQLGPYCVGATPDVLPTTSNNGVGGIWNSPIYTGAPGTTVYTFFPLVGQCAITTTMTIIVNAPTTPTFNPVAPICAGGQLDALPTTSLNGYTGTWTPALNNLNTTTYTFTPDAGQCATAATMSVVVNALIMPTFNPLGAYTQGVTAPALPLTSLNGIVGTWNPAVVNTTTPGTFPYVFTPNAGQCASVKTVNIQIIPAVPALTFLNDIGTTIMAAWPAVADAGLYNFSYRPSPTAPWINLGAVSPYVKVINLIPGTNYECMVKAYRANGQFMSAATIYGNFTTTATDYATSYNMGTTLMVDWSDYAPWASSYVFQYKKTGDPTWKIATAYLPETKLTNLIAESSYDVKVMVYKAGVLWGTTFAGTITTGKVAFTVSNNTGTTLDLSYAGTPDFTPWASTYGLSYKAQSSSTWINLVAVAAPVNHLIGLTANTVYDCKVAIYKGTMLWGVSQQGTFSTSLVKSTVSDNSNSVTIYPNPFVDQVNMELFTEKETKVIYDIYDVTGNVVLSGSQTINSGYSTLNIDAAGLSKGVYMLRAVMNDEMQSFRIMKQ